MLSERVAIALMILKKNTYEEIENKLKVSKSTIWKVSTWLSTKGEGYRKLLSDVIKKDSKLKASTEMLFGDLENQFIPHSGHNWKADARNLLAQSRRNRSSFLV